MKFTKRFLATVLTIVLTLSLGLPLTASAQSEEPLAFWAPVYIMNFDQTGRQLDVSGGLAPYRFEIDQNSLGLSVNADTGRVYSDGTRKSGSVTVTVFDANNDSATCKVRLMGPVQGWLYQNVIVGLGFAFMAIGSWLASPFILLYHLIFG